MFVRKARAGSAAHHTWPHDGAVVDVPDHVGAELVNIPDGGFTEVSPDSVGHVGVESGPDALAHFRREVHAALEDIRADVAQLRARMEDPTRAGTAAPAGAGPSGGPDHTAGGGPATAGSPGAATDSGGKRPPTRK